MASDRRFMAMALGLGRRGQGRSWPNPAVGCVIVRDGCIVGRGWTQPGGRPHAEVEALARAGDLARGATAYVTLEPCAHHGATPPCADALVAAGVVRVVAAIGDIDCRTAGRGFDRLRRAGVAVTKGVLAAEALHDHAGFLLKTGQGRPMLALKMASSIDGRISTASGHSKWITGPQARRAVHAMRARHDAVLVGGGTARKDDPSLTIRDLGIAHQPVRIVVSRRLDLPLGGNLAQSARESPLWLCHGPDADPDRRRNWRDCGARLIECCSDGHRVDPVDMLLRLGATGLTRILCEGGSELAASLVSADLVDELIGFVAGIALGAAGLPALGALETGALEAAPRYELANLRPLGGDAMLVWRKVRDSEPL